MKPKIKKVILLLNAIILLSSKLLLADAMSSEIQKQKFENSSQIKCEIKQYVGNPTMFINGRPQFPMAYMSYFPRQTWYQQIGDHNVHMYSLSLTLTNKWFNRAKQHVSHKIHGIWLAPDKIDFAVIEKALAEILEVDPNAYIFPRIYCDSPSWWDELHPDDVRIVENNCPLRQSLSSLTWRNETAKVLEKIVKHVSASKYGNHVIGYMICAGQTEEYGDQYDFTQCAKEQFKKWIEEKYGKNNSKIQQLFGKNLDSITIPTETEQKTGDCGNFLDPVKSRLVIDYRYFHSKQVADSAIYLCKAVKDASDGRLITGIFYGYTRIWPDWGHLAMRRILESDAIDFISNPYSSGGTNSYEWVGNRDFHTFTENSSVRKAGKLFYYENDIRTSQSRWIAQSYPEIDPNGEYSVDGWLGPKKLSDSLELLKAVFAKNFIDGSPNWWFDLWGGWYDNNDVLNLFALMQKAGDESIHLSRKSVAQIAVFLDENSYCYIPNEIEQGGQQYIWIENQLEQLGAIGAPYDFYLLDDLKSVNLSKYRMVVFLNAFALTKDQIKFITNKCMTDDRWLIWLYAPGIIQKNLSIDNISSLLGMNVKMDMAHSATNINMKLSEEKIEFEGSSVSPFIYVEQGADVIYGNTVDNRIVVAEKTRENCHNLFVAMPPLPCKALQYFAKRAGVHLYNEDGVIVFANENYLAISSAIPGKRTISLPKKTTLRELLAFNKAESFEDVEQFEINFQANTCRIFKLSE
jgi:beta-galactosidase